MRPTDGPRAESAFSGWSLIRNDNFRWQCHVSGNRHLWQGGQKRLIQLGRARRRSFSSEEKNVSDAKRYLNLKSMRAENILRDTDSGKDCPLVSLEVL